MLLCRGDGTLKSRRIHGGHQNAFVTLAIVAAGARTVFLIALAIAIRGALLHLDEDGLGCQRGTDTGDPRDFGERSLDRAGASAAHHRCGEFETIALHCSYSLLVLLGIGGDVSRARFVFFVLLQRFDVA
jgi:hypothetical protein